MSSISRWSKRLQLGLPSYQVTSRYWSYIDVQLPQLLLVTKVDGQRGLGYQVTRLPVVLVIRRCAVTSVTLSYQGQWSKRLGLPSYQVTSRYWLYGDMQLPQLLLVYQGRWSKRLGLPSYQVTSRYWSYVDVQLPQLLLVTKVDDERGWGYQVTRLPVDIGRM